jgi:hypothetical protein
MGEVVIEIGQLDHSCDPSVVSGRLGNPADVSGVRDMGPVGEQAQRGELGPRQTLGLQLGAGGRGELEDLMEQSGVACLRRDPVSDALDVREYGLSDPPSPSRSCPGMVVCPIFSGKEAATTHSGGRSRVRRHWHGRVASPDEGDENRRPAEKMFNVESTHTSVDELLLRGLAESDDRSVRSVLVLNVTETIPRVGSLSVLSPGTASLVHLAALLAAGASTT